MPATLPWMEEFLRSQPIATIATVQPSGYPHLSPVSFLWDGRKAIVTTTKQTAKYRNLVRNPLMTLHVADAAAGRWVSLEGKAAISDHDLMEPILAIIMKGLPDRERARRRVERLLATQQRVIIALTPSRTIAWERPA